MDSNSHHTWAAEALRKTLLRCVEGITSDLLLLVRLQSDVEAG